MKQLFTFPTEELKQKDTVYISIVLELHAARLINEADRIQFSNLLNDVEKELNDSDLKEKDALLKQLDVVRLNTDQLANHTSGLAIYITAENIYYYDLAIPVEKTFVIDERPYILPLVENFQFEQDYHLLLLNREDARIFEGHGSNLTELDMTEIDEDAPVDLETAIEKDRQAEPINFHSYNSATGGSEASQFFHGHDQASQEKAIERESYFRILDKFILEHYSNINKWPLVLFTVDENRAVFQSITNNKYLSELEIAGSSASMKENEIVEIVAEKINNLIGKEKRVALKELEEVSPVNRIENIPDDLTSASLRGQIQTLYLKKGLVIPGTITDEGFYNREDEKNNFVELLVDKVINTGASAYILDSEDMPKDLDIIARLRF